MNLILNFLKDLSKNNNREWFNEHKETYRTALSEFNHQVEKVIIGLGKFDKNLLNVQAKDTVFRIYKDIRFSKDKTPYKTHFGAYMAKGGRKSQDAAYYMHIEPEGTFIAAGAYMPDKDRLKALRQEIVYNPDGYMGIVNACKKKGYAQLIHEDTLKKAPQGFSPDFKFLDEIKLKHFIFTRNYSDEEVLSEDFINSVIKDYRGLYPFNEFLNNAMEFIGNE